LVTFMRIARLARQRRASQRAHLSLRCARQGSETGPKWQKGASRERRLFRLGDPPWCGIGRISQTTSVPRFYSYYERRFAATVVWLYRANDREGIATRSTHPLGLRAIGGLRRPFGLRPQLSGVRVRLWTRSIARREARTIVTRPKSRASTHSSPPACRRRSGPRPGRALPAGRGCHFEQPDPHADS
jgi:hypothetical protein